MNVLFSVLNVFKKSCYELHGPVPESTTNEPRHDKTSELTVRPAKTQISLGIRPVWSVFAVRLMGS